MTNKMKQKLITIALIISTVTILNHCQDKTPAVYEKNSNVLYQGSLLYVEAGCHGCHGVKWDGQSDEAKDIKNKNGITVTNFVTPAKKRTVVDYFKVITTGEKSLTNAKIPHSYQNYTDAGRWAMAHFLYSLGPDDSTRESANESAMNEVIKAYQQANSMGARRWNLGFKTLSPDDKGPSLKKLIKQAGNIEQTNYKTEVSEENAITRASDDSRGSNLYRTNCLECHGAYGQGGDSGKREGLVNCSDGKTNCSTYLVAIDLKKSSKNEFNRAHVAKNSLTQPSFSTLNNEEIAEIFDYLR